MGLASYRTVSGWQREGSDAAFRAHHTGHCKVSETEVTNIKFMILNYSLTSLYSFYSAKKIVKFG